MSRLSETILANNAKVRARRDIQTIQQAANERDKLQRDIARKARIAKMVFFFAIAAYILGAIGMQSEALTDMILAAMQ